MAQCAGVLEKAAPLGEAKPQKWVATYAEQALAMLRQAIRKGYQDAARLKKEKLRLKDEMRSLARTT